MSVIYIDVKERKCPYCKLNITPRLVKLDKERRLICPKCNLTIEVFKEGKR